MKRDLINIEDLTLKEINSIFDLARELKKEKALLRQDLKGKVIAVVFQKPSNRTRVSFEVGIRQLGGSCLYLGPEEINLGKRESASDVAQTLSRYLDGIVARTHRHQDVVDLAKYSSIPIINGLSDVQHPCQALADLFSIREKFGRLKNLTLAYVGDGNNVCHSLLLACAQMGVHIKVAAPKGYEPLAEVVKRAKGFAQKTKTIVLVSSIPQEVVNGAHVLYTDVWVSMGEEKEAAHRRKSFRKFQINSRLAQMADSQYIFMHCLPAHRGEEVTADVIDGPHSIVFDQVENRLHVQKAILLFLLKGIKGGS